MSAFSWLLLRLTCLLTHLFTKTLYSFPPHTCYMPLPSQYSLFNHFNNMYKEYRPLSSPLCSFLHSLVASSLLCPNILLQTLFSDTLSLRSSLNVNDQVLHPCKTKDKIIILYILIFKFLDCNPGD